MYSFCAMYSFRMSFCRVPVSVVQSAPCRSATTRIHGQDHRGRRVDRHRGADVLQPDPVEQTLHVGKRGNADAALADFATRQGMVGIAPHQGRQVEGDTETGAPGRQQFLVTPVGVRRRSESGKLPHGPEFAAVPVGVDAPCERERPRRRRRLHPVEIARGVQRLDLAPGYRRVTGFGVGGGACGRLRHGLAAPAIRSVSPKRAIKC